MLVDTYGVLMCMVTWNNILRDAMHQGPLDLCWAVAITSCIEALLFIALKKRVLLSAQHLVNNIKNMEKSTGKLKKYNEVRDFLTTDGLPSEGTCPYTKKIGLNCPKSCQQSDEHRYKIKELTYLKGKKFTETDVIDLLQKGPVLAVIETYQSFLDYEDGIYEGRSSKKDTPNGRHVVVVTGYNTTPEGINYWTIQNSWETTWGQKGFGNIIRQSSRRGNNPDSLLRKIIQLQV